MTTKGTLPSGSYKRPLSGRMPQPAKPVVQPKPAQPVLPKIIPYPRMQPFSEVAHLLKDRTCYIIKRYNQNGISVLVTRRPEADSVAVLCGDWFGNSLDLVSTDNELTKAALVFLNEDLPLFITIMRTIKLLQAQFFLTIGDDGKLVLVDIQKSADMLVGPGMVRDIFGKIYKTQEAIKVETPMNDQSIEYILKGSGSYEGDLIIKPSKFSTFAGPTSIIPLYAEVRR